MKVFRSTVIDAPIERVWALVRQFDGVRLWHPAVTECHIGDGQAATLVGCIRHIVLQDGGVIRETLLALDDRRQSFTYDIIESPLPVTNYVASQRFYPITDGSRTYATWDVEFDTDSESKMEQVIGEDIFMGGYRGLQQYLAG